ncbi:hypothetical protein GWI33_018030 [Rhynchophorus ferrugineus]|uniref:Uncharacterized protein n=1 Tax=Rhynchophorus ferrugineus TaxID=354439 RepID=A0A834M342_RHYFE|nr:hypothetical protein GWI33_018030 [Rhynchophorus ferrugineus]
MCVSLKAPMAPEKVTHITDDREDTGKPLSIQFNQKFTKPLKLIEDPYISNIPSTFTIPKTKPPLVKSSRSIAGQFPKDRLRYRVQMSTLKVRPEIESLNGVGKRKSSPVELPAGKPAFHRENTLENRPI